MRDTMARRLEQALEQWRDAPADPSAVALLAAAAAAADADPAAVPAPAWREFLEVTGRPGYLSRLPDDAARRRWADVAVAAVRHGGETVGTLLARRAATLPDRTFLRDDGRSGAWTFRAVRDRTRVLAAALCRLSAAPRVALWTPNSLAGALVDLACLSHGLLVTPLAPSLDTETVAWICRRLEIDLLLTGGEDLHARGGAVVAEVGGPLRQLLLDPAGRPPPGSRELAEVAGRLSPAEVDTLLADRPPVHPDAPATVMFTSGSTGRPKGVLFSQANMVIKRYARAAALPTVGRDEVLFSFLPLYHTFGRFLELQGMLFWGGTYVFAENPSRETLLRRLPEVAPTGLVSVPIRWQQLWEECRDRAGAGRTPDTELVRQVVGPRLRWGLSAAGYLDPRVFRFFQRHGVELCSGFGMTEATGGITMTPPGAYRDHSVGLPLPAIDVRLAEETGEMQIRGPYVARYLDPEPESFAGDWLRTGDIFRRHPDGHLEIVDRLKDIYKNSRGQTVAPRRVEQLFTGVPGIRRVFLVGDHRNDNVLLIVPDPDDPVLEGDPASSRARAYFQRIVTSANAGLPPHERVVNFAVLDRDFSAERGELTPKGSYRRKVIEEHFADVIEELYRREAVRLRCGDLTVHIPRWLVRETGILETDLAADSAGIRDTSRGLALTVRREDADRVRVGDLAYEMQGDTVRLGRLARHPLLWVGNDALVRFLPIRDGWESDPAPFGVHVFRPRDSAPAAAATPAQPKGIRDRQLPRLHELAVAALFGEPDAALPAVEGLAATLDLAETRVAELVRRRLEAVADHPDMAVRARAYRALLLDETNQDPDSIRPRFLESGQPFLDQATIAAVAEAGLEPRRLASLRRRLHAYRKQIPWPAGEVMRSQLAGIFSLLGRLARRQPDYYGAVRDELVSWITLCDDPAVAAAAREEVLSLAAWYEATMREQAPSCGREHWESVVLFQQGVGPVERERVLAVLADASFLEQSVRLAFDGQAVTAAALERDSVWVGRQTLHPQQALYRLSLNTPDHRHFDLQLVVWDHDHLRRDRDRIEQTIYWLITLSGHPHGPPMLPRFGCYRAEQGALSLAYVDALSVWDRIEEYAREYDPAAAPGELPRWQRLFVQALAVFFRGWAVSGRRIVPGLVDPANVAVDASDFREASRILSLSGWTPYRSPRDLVLPMLRNFYRQTAVAFPRTRRHLQLFWLADACLEALGTERGLAFLAELEADLAEGGDEPLVTRLRALLPRYRRERAERPYLSCSLLGAAGRYHRWLAANPEAAPAARLQLVDEMLQLYGLHRQPPLQRFLLYRATWFHDAPAPVQEALDRLLATMHRHPERPVTNLPELSDLQVLLDDRWQREAFQRMAFPHSRGAEAPELLAVGERERRQVAVRTVIHDREGQAYTVREPVSPAEVGSLYRLFFQSGYYRTISAADHVLLVQDAQEQIVGGISWRPVDNRMVHLNGIVVATPLLGRGLSSAMIEDFCGRMADLGYNAVKTLFVMRPFFEKQGFRVDRRWGGLVRSLLPATPADDDPARPDGSG